LPSESEHLDKRKMEVELLRVDVGDLDESTWPRALSIKFPP
jgi:hypothetical protein